MEELSEETREDYIRRLAKQRYEFRLHFKYRLNDTANDDWAWATEQIRQEEVRNAQLP